MSARHAAHRWGTRSGLKKATGYTLLEVIVAGALTAVLLTSLWGVFRTYLRLFETGERVVNTARLQQSLTEQLRRDLDSVAALATAGHATTAAAGGGTSGLAPRRDEEAAVGFDLGWLTGRVLPADSPLFGPPLPPLPELSLQGTGRWLRLAGVQQVPELQPDPRIVPPRSNATLEFAPSTIALELRVIEYRWVDQREAAFTGAGIAVTEPDSVEETASGYPMRSGLYRFETSWEEFHVAETPDPGWIGEHLGGVSGIRFRYFDGTLWRSTWDSHFHDHLPVAIEVFFRLDDGRRADGQRIVTAAHTPQGAAPLRESETSLHELDLQDISIDQLRALAGDSVNTGVYRVLLNCSVPHLTVERTDRDRGLPSLGR